jgi:hypothetical protein
MSEWRLRTRAGPSGSTQNYSSFVTNLAIIEVGPETYGRRLGREFKSIRPQRLAELGALSGVQCTISTTIDRRGIFSKLESLVKVPAPRDTAEVTDSYGRATNHLLSAVARGRSASAPNLRNAEARAR